MSGRGHRLRRIQIHHKAFVFMHDNVLYVRLQSCLQAILDLEQSFTDTDLKSCAELRELFVTLKESLGRLDEIHCEAEDVERIEQAVAVFLREVKPTAQILDKKLYSGWILQ